MQLSKDEACIILQQESIAFKHKDRQSRYFTLFDTLLSSNLHSSFPAIFRCQYDLKAFYRLINNKAIDMSTFVNGYQKGLQIYSKSVEDKETWILIHDSMFTDYNSRSVDFGYTQTITSNGFLLHHGLLLDSNFVPLGLLHQEVYHREKSDFGKSHLCNTKEIKDKESNKWLNGIKAGQAFTQETQRPLIHIMDREADIEDVIKQCQEGSQNFIIRARHDRSTLNHTEREKVKNKEAYRLFQLMRSASNKLIITRTIKDEKGNDYEAECYLHYSSFVFRGLQQGVNCVWLQEIKAAGETGVEWFLLTNLHIANENDAIHSITLYAKRWTIEDFHKCYKTGCSIEKRQFDSRKTVTTTIAFLALPAIILLRSRYLAKVNPDANITEVITDNETRSVVNVLAKKYMKPIDYTVCKENTVLWWLLLLGRMGGHQGYKQKGLPGWQTIWRGYSYFQQVLEVNNMLKNTS
jgi:hypothetical protein